MSYLKLIAAAAFTLAAAAPVFASPPQVNDGVYIEAERCQALFAAPVLGAPETSGIDQFLKVQDGGRDQAAYDQGQEARRHAATQVRLAGAYERSQLTAERNGECQSLMAGPAMASTGHGAMAGSN